MVGQKIGHYRVIERLGAGGMGSVYRAVDEAHDREVALKILPLSEEHSAARLRAEAGALARLDHPGIAKVYELIEDDGRLVMAMELVHGQTLQHLIHPAGMLSPRDAAEVCMQTLTVLEHAHAAGIVHRDLKPTNLMLTDDGSVKIMDFGIARVDGSVNLTNAGAMVGTPAYMAPEQVLGQPIDVRTDLYSLGVVFFRLVTAELPFKGETPVDMAQAHLNDTPATATDFRPDLPSWVNQILTRALQKNPDDRFQSASDFYWEFARALAEMPQPETTAAGVESTAVMARTEAPTPATAHDVRNRRASARRSDLRAMWLTAAATVFATGVWSLSPFGAETPDAAASATFRSIGSASRKAPAPGAGIATATPARVANAALVKSAGAPALAAASFSDVKFLAVNGSRTSASDVVLQFFEKEVGVQFRDGSPALAALPYRRISKATYAQGRDPQWDASLSGPAGKIDVPGFMGRARHWLVLQSQDRYVILRLDGNDRLDVMKAFEERAGVVIDRK